MKHSIIRITFGMLHRSSSHKATISHRLYSHRAELTTIIVLSLHEYTCAQKGDMISHFFFSYVSHVVICKMKINNVPFCHTTGYAMKTSKIMILLTCTCINAQCLQSRKERPLHTASFE